MKTTQDLSSAWMEAVTSGKITNEFEASGDDPTGRWSKGDRVRFGLTCCNGGIQYDARNVQTGSQIEATIEERAIGSTGFVCQFNGYRALRPGGSPQRVGRQPDISPTSADCRFYCQDPKKNLSLLRRDPLLQVRLTNGRWNAYYNASPFEKEGHFLWVPVIVDGTTTVIPHVPQMLTLQLVEDLIDLFRKTTETIVFFNSLHAGASVNHFHAQAVFHKQRLAIEDAPTIDYKGFSILDGYPAQAFCFRPDSDIQGIVEAIDRLQGRGVPFNLILLGERVLLVPRSAEHEIVAEFPEGVLATMEIAGKIITVDRRAFDTTDAAQIAGAFGKVTLNIKEVIDGWETA